jgi:inorganic triphosphatase YgiF
MSGARERELKFEFDAGEPVETAVDAVLRTALSAETRKVQQIESVYFDTSALDLRARGMVLRVRRNGDRYVQTIKRSDGPGASFDRWESEHEIAGPQPQLSSKERMAFAAVALRFNAKRLRPVFTVKSERTTWSAQADGADIEFALDRGEIAAGGATSTLCELEVELKQGPTKNLFDLGRRLVLLAKLRPTTFTKDERGYRLLEERWDQAVHASRAPVEPLMDPREAFRAIALDCLHQFTLNERLVRASCDSEAIHQARIAVRRLRSALTVFKSVARDARYAAVKADLKALSDALGSARDAAVFEQRILKAARDEPDAPAGFAALATRVDQVKQQRYHALVATLNAPEQQEKLLGLIEWVEAGDWRTGAADETETAVRFAKRRLRKVWRAMHRESADIGAAPDEVIHDLRKRAKRLRYAAEFFTNALTKDGERRAHRASLRALENVQKNLGRRQDMVAAREMLASIAADASTTERDLVFAAGHLDGCIRRDLAKARKPSLKKAAASIAAAKPFAG